MHHLNLQKLEPLELGKCKTVSDIVDGMRHTAFGARMLGDVAHSWYGMLSSGQVPCVVYDGKTRTPLGNLLGQMRNERMIGDIVTPEDYANNVGSRRAIVVGDYSERHEDKMYKRSEEPIFINAQGRAKPGQIRDGYFPNAVFADPLFVMPVLYYTLRERMGKGRTTVRDLMENLKPYGGMATNVADGAETLLEMVRDPDCRVFLTLSGAMTMAQMDYVICEMIDRGYVNYISTTGALLGHGLVKSIGLAHYRHDPRMSDVELAAQKLNRVTDTLEPETNLDTVEAVVRAVLNQLPDGAVISPSILNEMLGEHLVKTYPNERGVLMSARNRRVPVFSPAFVDSELGNDTYIHNLMRRKEGRDPILMNMEIDSERLVQAFVDSEKIGIYTVGGGVPRNNTQNVAPLIEIMVERGVADLPLRMISYGVRTAPDEMWYGHLSGCTYDEGMSWRKMDPKGRFSEIQGDATQVWPLHVKYVMETEDAEFRTA